MVPPLPINVSSCTYVAHHSCAQFPIICPYWLPISRAQSCTRCPYVAITRAQSCPLCAYVGCQSLVCQSCAKFPISRWRRVPSIPCQSALLCLCCPSRAYVAKPVVPLLDKLLVPWVPLHGAIVNLVACQMLPLCANLPVV